MTSLKGKRILVTREASAAKRFAEKIAASGGKPVITPLLQIQCLPNSRSIDLKAFDWVFFTSKNGVDCFLQSENDVDALAECKIAAVGTKTGQALKEHGLCADFVPSTFNAQVMAAEFLSVHKESGPILLVRGTLASPVLPEAFTKAEHPFTCLEVYETVTNDRMKDQLQTALMQGGIDMLTFTSPSTVNAFIELAGDKQDYLEWPVACIGTTTEKRAKELGFNKTIVPQQFTVEGMIEAMSEYLK